ncbi:MAG: ATP-binding protein [Bifidobacterium adolescentis]
MSGYHEFRPSMDDTMPVTLLAGASESGKSTLVDAQISLLYPSGTPYNKASNSGRSERNDYTYLRGMIGVQRRRKRRDADLPARQGRGRRPAEHLGRDRRHIREPAPTADCLSCAKFLYLSRRRRAGRTAPPVRHLEPDHRPAPHGPAPRHAIHARTDGTDLPRMHDARQRRRRSTPPSGRTWA